MHTHRIEGVFGDRYALSLLGVKEDGEQRENGNGESWLGLGEK